MLYIACNILNNYSVLTILSIMHTVKFLHQYAREK